MLESGVDKAVMSFVEQNELSDGLTVQCLPLSEVVSAVEIVIPAVPEN